LDVAASADWHEVCLRDYARHRVLGDVAREDEERDEGWGKRLSLSFPIDLLGEDLKFGAFNQGGGLTFD
jgi:hypothetical protein